MDNFSGVVSFILMRANKLMKLYPNVFAYLNQVTVPFSVLAASDRPILVLDNQERIEANPLLIRRDSRLYEVGFPYLNPADLKHHESQLVTELIVVINEESDHWDLRDEVIDEGIIEDENKLEEWQNSSFRDNIDSSVGLLLQNFVALLSGQDLWSQRRGDQAKIYLDKLGKYLNKFDVADATLPLVVTLEKHYELTRKLREITPKLRHQLRRQAELMPLGRIQEMDSYCLRDYTRRPGRTPEEKAGSRQELMGVQRYLDFNTLENQFLVYFASKILHFECFCYERNSNQSYLSVVKKLRQTIDIFKQQPQVKNISSRYFKLTKPNYVLQQNQIYSSFYRAYLDYLNKRTEKEKIWSFRNILLGEVIYLCLLGALLGLQGIKLEPLVYLQTRTTPDQGNYFLTEGEGAKGIQVVLNKFVYDFKLEKKADLRGGDLSLTVELHDLDSRKLTTVKKLFPVWIFWYKPETPVISGACEYMENQPLTSPIGLVIYLQTPPNYGVENSLLKKMHSRLWLCQIANPIVNQNIDSLLEFLAKEVIISLGEAI